MKRLFFYCTQSTNCFETIFDYEKAKLEIYFSGTPKVNNILTLESEAAAIAARQYLKCQNFKYMKSLNCLDFGNLEILLSEKSYVKSLIFLSKNLLPQKFLRRERIYVSGYKDLILWKILSNRNLNFNLV